MTPYQLIFMLTFSLAILGCTRSESGSTSKTAPNPRTTSAKANSGVIENEINGGWYGWIGNHRITNMYDPEMDAAGMRRHHINWYWLGKQWVVPFLVADLADVRQTMIEESRRARIWVELYWWGDHSTWDGFHGITYPELQQRLKAKGVPPGGDNLGGKDWFAIAEDPKVMASVKKTIKWQLDTMAQYLGANTVYGVLLSEEEPEHGIDVTVGQAGARRYTEDRERARQVLIQVHNELYDYVKSLYPNLRISPGFYPKWVKPGTLKYDAVVMDDYPGFGQEEEKLQEWLRAYGKDVEQYVLLWGYGNLDYQLELARLEKTVKLHRDHGIRNLGFFHPSLALRDPIYRMFDTRGAGSYASYDLAEHQGTVADLREDTTRTVEKLGRIPGVQVKTAPAENPAQAGSRKKLCAMADRIYAYRKALLDTAYVKAAFSKEWVDFSQLAQLAYAEGWIPKHLMKEYPQISQQTRAWETLSKEFRTLPKFYEAVLPVEREIRPHAVEMARALLVSAKGDPAIQAFLEHAAHLINQDAYASAFGRLKQARDLLVKERKEKSWEIVLRLGNRYGYPLTAEVILSVDYGDGQPREIYRGIPFEASKQELMPLNFVLPNRPQAMRLATGPWSGDLVVHGLRVLNSRETLQPALVEEDHVKGVKEYLAHPSGGFELCPWSSASHVTLKYPAH